MAQELASGDTGPAQKSGSPAQGDSAPPTDGSHPMRPTRRGVLRMPAWLRWVLIALLLALLGLATLFASRQAPHPDMFRTVATWDIADPEWWAYPLERNAFRRQVVRGDLHAVFALPGTRKLWSVGEGGLILHSADDGATWVQQRPAAVAAAAPAGEDARAPRRSSSAWSWLPQAVAADSKAPPYAPPPNLAAQQQQLPDTKGVQQRKTAPPAPQGVSPQAAAVPAEAASSSAAPAPRQAAAAAQPVGTATLSAVHFADGLRGWAVGADGTILATRDGGAQWVAQTSGSRASLRSVQFAADGLRGWAVGVGGTILATLDGGAQWVSQTSGSRAWLLSVQFAADGQRGWAVGDGGTILATRNGGAQWVSQTSGSRAWLESIQFAADGLRGWAVGNDGTILATRDGGAQWVAQTSGSQASLLSVKFAADGLRGWAVGADGTILATRNGGAQWVAQTSGSRASLFSVQFAADGLRGWAVGVDGTILATRDGGAQWAAQTSGSRASLTSVQFAADGLRGWAVGDDGTILATRDGGAQWVSQTSGSRAWLLSVQFAADGQRGWAVGDGGTILATRNGGAQWVSQTSGSRAWLFSVQFAADGLRGWAVGEGGTILATRDGGAQWVAQTSGSRASLFSVQFAADGLRGWAVGVGGTILATRDGGAQLAAQTSGSRASLTSVQFAADGLRGWAVGEDSTILATRDGGAQWVAQTSGSRAWLFSVQFAADGLRGWAVGNDGTILATRDGGAQWVAQTSGSRASLNSVQFAADGQRGWAVGEGGTILATRDGGAQWADAAPYRRSWAPWYFAILPALALALFGVLGFVEPVRRGEAAQAQADAAVEGAATFLRSDQPVADKAFDRLGVRPVVEALSSFIRNRGTEPRVTIAVTGEWGNGKSSVMRMLQTDLDRAGFRTAWFNAWHHQQEGRPLTALFNAVRQQAVPQWWRQPLAALRVRSGLIWGRGMFYKLVAIAMALAIALAAGDMFADGWRSALDNTQHFLRHHVLQKRQTAITGASLAGLDPFARAASAPAAAASEPAAASKAPRTVAAAVTPATNNPCDAKSWPVGDKAEPVRPEVYCYLKRNLQWSEGGDGAHCGVQHDPRAAPGRQCVFASADDLIATVEARDAAGARKLWPSERKAIRAAAETLPPPPLFPWLEGAFVGGLAALLALVFTKGITVYGLQLTAPLRALLAAAAGKGGDEGKESSGTVERYRAEFGLLCDALDGRLVIFIDDLDRCTPETVNGMLELTNYLADVGKCFVVIGAAMDRVLRSVRSPVPTDDHSAYATAYLRKLVHIELPVPQNRPLLERLAAAEPTTTPDGEARSGLRRAAWRWGLGSAAVLGLLAVFIGGVALHDSGKGTALRVAEVPAAMVGAASAPVPPNPRGSEPSPGAPERPTGATEVGLVATAAPALPLDWLAAAALLALAALVWRWVRRNREQVVKALGGALRPEDSSRFIRALKIWNPVVVSYDPTPRHVKRFYNRARLFAAYEQQAGVEDPASDETMVALAAMHHFDPALLAALVSVLERAGNDESGATALLQWMHDGVLGPDGADGVSEDTRLPSGARAAGLDRAWTAHIQTFGSVPSARQASRFADRLSGILVR